MFVTKKTNSTWNTRILGELADRKNVPAEPVNEIYSDYTVKFLDSTAVKETWRLGRPDSKEGASESSVKFQAPELWHGALLLQASTAPKQ